MSVWVFDKKLYFNLFVSTELLKAIVNKNKCNQFDVTVVAVLLRRIYAFQLGLFKKYIQCLLKQACIFKQVTITMFYN